MYSDSPRKWPSKKRDVRDIERRTQFEKRLAEANDYAKENPHFFRTASTFSVEPIAPASPQSAPIPIPLPRTPGFKY